MMTCSISADRRQVARVACGALVAALLAGAALVAPVRAHHSFAIFDSSVTKVFTGVVVRVNPDVNHLQIFFAVMNDERTNVIRDDKGEPVIWAVEMAGSAQSARDGISVNAFPPRTIISVGLHPLRSGEPAGDRGRSALIKCPANTPPPPGKHCDSVEGHTAFGSGALPAPTE
jgi:hypothetical protein